MTPMEAIREKCLDCCCGSVKAVRLCAVESCPLYAFRSGKNPNRRKTVLTESERAELASHFSGPLPQKTAS